MAADNVFLVIFILRMKVQESGVVCKIAKTKTMKFIIYNVVYIYN
jgi:hypothetical protein